MNLLLFTNIGLVLIALWFGLWAVYLYLEEYVYKHFLKLHKDGHLHDENHLKAIEQQRLNVWVVRSWGPLIFFYKWREMGNNTSFLIRFWWIEKKIKWKHFFGLK